MSEGNTHKALENYLKALDLKPKLQAALVNAGQAYDLLGETAMAEKMLRAAVANDARDEAPPIG